MTTHYSKLEEINKRIHRFSHLGAILSWDEAVNMPKGSGEARAESISELYAFISDEMKRPEILEYIDKAKNEDLSELQKANLELVERDWKNSNVLDTDFVRKKSLTNMKCEQAWRQYREENDWESFRPHLEDVVTLIKEEAALRSDATGMNKYDSLLDLYEPGLRSSEVDEIFNVLIKELPTLRNEIVEFQTSRPFTKPEGPFAAENQKELGVEIMNAMGFDFTRGRLDVSHHPFCGGVPEDVRMTTRYSEDDFTESLMGIIHETGHARYEQNLPVDWITQPLGQSKGMAIHEGQSLFFEMQMGRSKEFLQYALPLMKKHVFNGKSEESWTEENMTRLYQHVTPGYIRVDADEVTYPFHVILRYEIERDILEGKIEVKDLPEIWDAKMQEYLGLSTKGNYKDGVMQDVHWPSGAMGYFPTYTLGAMVAAQVFDTLEKSNPNVKSEIATGEFGNINSWLKENVWGHGSRYELQDLMQKVTGQKLSADIFIKHLKNRYLS
ncbi:MAG: carboxypeptidase M32 [Bacteriovoracaceae bacterium]|nr:carboxypeptidase M32 [Bacteriovoracaceae bacterium]